MTEEKLDFIKEMRISHIKKQSGNYIERITSNTKLTGLTLYNEIEKIYQRTNYDINMVHLSEFFLSLKILEEELEKKLWYLDDIECINFNMREESEYDSSTLEFCVTKRGSGETRAFPSYSKLSNISHTVFANTCNIALTNQLIIQFLGDVKKYCIDNDIDIYFGVFKIDLETDEVIDLEDLESFEDFSFKRPI